MATNYIQPGENITVTAAAAISSGDGLQVGWLFGIASNDAAIGEDVVLATRGVYEIAKTSAQAWAVGDRVYWDATAGEATTATAVGANERIGVAVAAAANPSATGKVRLDGVTQISS